MGLDLDLKLDPVQWRAISSQGDDELLKWGQTVKESFWRAMFLDQWQRRRISEDIEGIPFPPSTKEHEDQLIALLDMGTLAVTSKHRVLFRTVQGLLGLGAWLTRPGDIVVVLLGGSVPCILRPSGGKRYTYIGGCFIHGIMDDEVIQAQRRGEYELQDFELD
ncbi:MAG: hypothetical protein Q9169_002673 [Polycauliona sp. 2 TL-2023]